MNVVKSLSFLDMVLLMAPIVAFTLLALFRMDEGMSAGQARVRPRRKFCHVDLDGRGRLLDPDGQAGNRIGFPQAGGKGVRKIALEPNSARRGGDELLIERSSIPLKYKELN